MLCNDAQNSFKRSIGCSGAARVLLVAILVWVSVINLNPVLGSDTTPPSRRSLTLSRFYPQLPTVRLKVLLHRLAFPHGLLLYRYNHTLDQPEPRLDDEGMLHDSCSACTSKLT